MSEASNCPSCGSIFMKNAFNTVCHKCKKVEEAFYDKVYNFMKKRENRAATMEQVINATGIEEELLYKFIKSGRIQTTRFPNFGYPCDKCGTIIRQGKLCDKCTNEIKSDLQQLERDEELKRQFMKESAYHTRK